MLVWLEGLSPLHSIIIAGGILALNLLYMFSVNAHIKRFYIRTGSVEQSMNRLRILNQYVTLIVVALTSFFNMFIFSNLLHRWLPYSGVASLIGLFCTFALLGLLIWANQLIMFNTLKMLRGTTESRKEQSGKTFRGILLGFIPMIFIFSTMTFLQNSNLAFFSNGYGFLLILLLLVVAVNIVAPLFIGKALKATPLPQSPLKDELLAFLAATDLQAVKIYNWPTRKSKTANALVTGLRTKRIYIADYMVEHLTINQLKGIVAHEIGHIKRHHLWKRLGLIIIFPIISFGIGDGFDWYEAHFHEIPFWLGITIFALLFIVYLGVIFRFFTRTQERQADEYVLELGIDYRDYATALIKLARLNHMMTKMNKVDEKFQTHPSIAKRVEWMIQKANGSFEELEAYDPEGDATN